MWISRLENRELTQKEVSSLDFTLSCDVLCVGAGCAGIYAADAAAREGADVILLENDVAIGGMHIQGGVRSYYYGAAGGSFEEDDSLCASVKDFCFAGHKNEKKPYFLLKRLEKSGVRLLCGHTPTGVIFEGRRVVGLCVWNGETEIYVRAKMTVDATSDGHLVRMCPVAKRYGRERDGKTAPFSVFAAYMKNGVCQRLNEDAGHIDLYDSRDFSQKTLKTHAGFARLLKNCEFLNLAAHTGVREGLSFEGEETLRYENIILKKPPEKVLFYAYSDLDRHGNDHAMNEELFQNWWVVSNLATVTLRIPVSLGAVVPKGILGLVTAGRCLSADTYSVSAVRMNRDMFRMGECVGRAAAMAVAEDVPFTEIDYERYLERVSALGCFAADTERDLGFDYPGGHKPYRPFQYNMEENLPLLRTETPGPAIFTAFLNREDTALADFLAKELESTSDSLYAGNLALALGIMGDPRALSPLRKIIATRDCFYFKDGRRSNQFRSAVALCLLGRLGDESDLPMLEAVVFDAREFEREMYHALPREYFYTKDRFRNFLYFDTVSHAAAALVKISLRLGLPTEGLNRRFRALAKDAAFFERMLPNCAPHESEYEEVTDFLAHLIELTDVR